jgi:hypothetical protein
VQDFTKEERMQLAVKSRTDVPKFGSAARQKVISDMHTRFIELQASLAAAGSSSGSNAPAAAAPAAAAPAARDVQSPPKLSLDQGVTQPDGSTQQQQQQPVCSLQQQQQQQGTPPQSPQVSAGGSAELVSHLHPRSGSSSSVTPAAAAVSPQQQQLPVLLRHQQQQQQRVVMAAPGLAGGVSDGPADRGLTFLIVVLSVAIAAMLLKKVIVAFGDVRHPMLQ